MKSRLQTLLSQFVNHSWPGMNHFQRQEALYSEKKGERQRFHSRGRHLCKRKRLHMKHRV